MISLDSHLSALTSIRAESQPLAETLRAAGQDGPLDWLPNPGNWGDSLIRVGTETFLRRHEIPYQLLRFVPGNRETHTLLYGGGGAWCRSFRHGLEQVRLYQQRYRRVIVLPSTIDVPLAKLDPSLVTLFPRDRRSVLLGQSEYLAGLSPDLALWAAIEPHPQGEGTLLLLRRGRGRHRQARHVPGSLDLSLAGDEWSPLEPLWDALRPYARIITDRLHMAIAAVLIGKRVDLLEGDYWKCRAVYETHLMHFPGCRFHDWAALPSLLDS